MAILNYYKFAVYQPGNQSSPIFIDANDTYAQVVATGYLNSLAALGLIINPSDFVFINYSGGSGIFSASHSAGNINLAPAVLLNNGVNAGQALSVNATAAAPGTIRAFTAAMTATATTLTSGNIVGSRGSATLVGNSGGYVYGTQGKVIATGTLTNSGGGFVAGMLGQFDMSAATIQSGAYMAPVWADWGSTAPSGTYPSCFGLSMTNSTAAILGAQINLYGGATNLLELNDNNALVGSTYFKAAGTTAGSWGNATPPTPTKVLQISINGTAYYLPIVSQNT